MTGAETFDARALLERLLAGNVDFIVIGGVAAALHGGSLVTADLDIMYERSSGNLQRLAEVLRSLNVRLRGAEELPLTVDAALLRNGDRFTFTSQAGDIDCLATADGAAPFPDLKARAVRQPLNAGAILVASLPDLITMKRAVNRPKDQNKNEHLAPAPLPHGQ